MKPLVLIHGYSAESESSQATAIAEIYDDLPALLRQRYGKDSVVDLHLARYLSLEDGVTLDDLTRAFDQLLRSGYANLLKSGFHALAHSTGALLVRNWLRGFSPKPSPIDNLVYLAGANFGSGWAHIGDGQFAKWGRKVFQGKERGVRILHALELGSEWALDLHRFFLRPENRLFEAYKVKEHVLIGSQAAPSWFSMPIRFAKEDGSDGVVRVSGSDLNFRYLRFTATPEARALSWKEARRESLKHLERSGKRRCFYAPSETSMPGEEGRQEIPLGILPECAHSGEEMSILGGSKPRQALFRLLDAALSSTAANWPNRVALFAQETQATYDAARVLQAPKWWSQWLTEPRAQYDGHSQLILRLRDQDGRPVTSFDVYFDSVGTRANAWLPFDRLIEHRHINSSSPHVITFYLRTLAFDAERKDWISRLPAVGGIDLEISATEPQTAEIRYLPLRYEFDAESVVRLLKPHTTTILDIELIRMPSEEVFRMVKYGR